MYNRIVNEEVTLRRNVSDAANDIISKLLKKNEKERLGFKMDFKEIRDHPFFLPVNWDKLLRRQVRAPFIPRIESEIDLRNISEDFVKMKINPASLIPQNVTSTYDKDFAGFTYVQNNISTT
ncbi:protein kinase domain protein [Oesophagostomum dentatum]|uniref:Protein kinase domain protein n=1 Tax=Oesophagostomum dentatum TaxID=61180 RepID=A0A0B1SKP8_OESDE|nr:protein kinase domain protein [Oesophagostomum dentatum]